MSQRTPLVRLGLLVGTVLALGLVTAVHLSGERIVTEGEDKLDQRLPPGQVSVVDAARALDFAPQQGQRSLYATLGERVPGVVLVVDPDRPGLATEEARALGRVVTIVEAPGFEVERPERRPDVEGLFRFGDWRPWELHLVDDDAGVLVVRDRRGTTLLVDGRLLDVGQRSGLAQRIGDLDLEAARADVATRPGPVAAALRESGLLVGLLLLGGLLLPVGVFAGRARPAVTLLVGVGVQGAVGAFVSGIALLVVPVLVAAGLGAWITWRRGAVGWSRADLPAVLASAAALVAVSLLVRTQGLVVVSTDGGSYLRRAAVQAAGDQATLGSKGPSFSALHATGMLVGADGLFALGPALLLAATVVIARSALAVLRGGARTLRAEHAGAAPLLLAAALGLLLILPLTSAGIRFSSMLVHAHLLVAAQTVALVALWAERDPSGRRGPVGGEAFAAAALAASIVLARPEGFIVPVLVLLGTLRSVRARPAWTSVFVVTGLAIAAQYGFSAANLGVLAEAIADEDPGRGVLGAAGSGLIGPLVALAPFVLWPLPARWRAQLPLIITAGVWIGALAALRVGALGLDRSLEVARVNTFTGAGGWGVTLPVLLVLALFALGLLLPRLGEPHLTPLVVLVVLYVPLAQLSKNLGDGIGRVHWHDSVNRMWMHVLLAVVLLVVLALAELVEGAPARRRWYVRAAAPVLALAMLAVVRPWDPVLAAEEPSERVVAPSSGPAVAAAQELTTGRQVLLSAELTLPDASALRRAEEVELCADVRFGTFARENTGRIEVRIALEGRSVPVTLDSATFVDNATERVCWSLGDGPAAVGRLGETVLVSVRGLDPSPAPTVMLAAGDRPDVTLVLRWVETPAWNTPLVRALPTAVAVLLALVLVGWSWGISLPAAGRARRR